MTYLYLRRYNLDIYLYFLEICFYCLLGSQTSFRGQIALTKLFIVQKQELLHSINTIMVFTGREGQWLSFSCAERQISKDGKVTQGQGQVDSGGLQFSSSR